MQVSNPIHSYNRTSSQSAAGIGPLACSISYPSALPATASLLEACPPLPGSPSHSFPAQEPCPLRRTDPLCDLAEQDIHNPKSESAAPRRSCLQVADPRRPRYNTTTLNTQRGGEPPAWVRPKLRRCQRTSSNVVSPSLPLVLSKQSIQSTIVSAWALHPPWRFVVRVFEHHSGYLPY